MNHPDYAVTAMEKYGGSFVRALAACYREADPDNRATLRQAFAAYFERYRALAEQTAGAPQ